MPRVASFVVPALILVGGTIMLLPRSQAYAWDDEFQAIVASGKADILTLPATLSWWDPRSLLRPAIAVALTKRVPDRSAVASRGIYDAVVSWAAPSRWRKNAQVGTWLERIDCETGRIGTFLRQHPDSATAPDTEPEAWWPMRPPEAAFFCPGLTIGIAVQPTESVFVSVPDSTLTESFHEWLASRNVPLRATLNSFGYHLETSDRPEHSINCQQVEYDRVSAEAGQVETVCSFTLASND